MGEGKIRDHISANLGLIDDNLILIAKEYQLQNCFGSKGYIDVLAKDQFNNFVIIEIKRSKATSRETIQEIIKYVGLLKQNFRVRDSEIKVIILSSDWTELIVPFSELLYQSTLHVKGYKLFLDPLQTPVSTEIVIPIKIIKRRKIADNSFLYLFKDAQKRETGIQYLKKRCGELGINDYLIVKICKSIEKYPSMPYHYCACLAFQSLSIHEYLDIVKKAELEIDMEQDEFDSESEFLHYLEQMLIVSINTSRYHDSAEAGYPDKMDSILGIQNWHVEETLRFGFFLTDPRYTDEILLRELRGLDGSSDTKYLNFAESSQTDRITEIRENCLMPLEGNEFWANHLHNIFEYLNKLGKPYRCVINVYHPPSIFDTIWRAMHNSNKNYLPIYLMFIDFIDKTDLWIFAGRLTWNGKPVDLEKFVEYQNDDTDTLLNKFLDCVRGEHDQEILRYYNLAYENTLAEFRGNKITSERNVFFETGELIKFDSNERTIFEWIDENAELKNLLTAYYETYTKDFMA